MIIEKIYNNNVLLAIDSKTKDEVILTGCGIAFKKKVGQNIDEDKVEKRYVLKSPSFGDKINQLANKIPEKIFEITSKIIEYTEKKLNVDLDEHIYIALTDHIYFGIKRYKENMMIKNELLNEIKRIHRKEYEVGLWAVSYINKKLDVKFTDDEAGFIALHIVNANFREEKQGTYISTKIIKGILNIIRYSFSVEFLQNDINYDRLITHLKYFSKRIISEDTSYSKESSELIDIIKEKYKDEYKCSMKIKKYIKDNFNYNVNDDEIVYLSIHISRVISVIRFEEKIK